MFSFFGLGTSPNALENLARLPQPGFALIGPRVAQVVLRPRAQGPGLLDLRLDLLKYRKAVGKTLLGDFGLRGISRAGRGRVSI